MYVGLTLLVGLAAANRPNNLLVWVFGAMLAGVLISGVVSGGMLMGVHGSRLDPRHGAVGRPLVLRYAITNRGRFWSAFNLIIEERKAGSRQRDGRDREGVLGWQRVMGPARGWVLHVGPGETVHGEAVYFPERRGRVAFHRFVVSTTFPFGFLRKSVRFDQRTETLIYPRLLELRRDLMQSFTRGGLAGFRLSNAAGAGEDYFGVREYRPGDSIRQIAWKRLAAGQGLVTIERSRSSPPRMRVVLNLRTPTDKLRIAAAGASPRDVARDIEEDAISLAASLIALAEDEGYEVGLCVLGLDAPPMPLRRGHWHVEKMMAALAALDLDAPRRGEERLPESDRDRAAIVVVHPDRAAPSCAPSGAWHLVASQLESFLAPKPTEDAAEPAPAKGAPTA